MNLKGGIPRNACKIALFFEIMSDAVEVVDELFGHPDITPPESIQSVILSGTVLLQIAKHATDLAANPGAQATGMLLGLDVNDALDVTFSHPLQTKLDNRDIDSELTPQQFQEQMLNQLRATSVHSRYCGWYRAGSLDELSASSTWASIVSYQADFQKNLPNSVVLMYDHSKAVKGLLSVRAFRLSSAFMALYAQAMNSEGKKQDDGNPSLSRTRFVVCS
jgi:translation initiation factor 3 subunit H